MILIIDVLYTVIPLIDDDFMCDLRPRFFQAVCLKATRTTSASVGAASCSVFFKIKTGVRFVWRAAGEGDGTALLVSVVSIGSTKVLSTINI